MMKTFLTYSILLLCFSASAQVTKDDINLVQAMYGKDKRDLMQEYMQFKDSTSASAFWKVYDRYEAERKLNYSPEFARNMLQLNN